MQPQSAGVKTIVTPAIRVIVVAALALITIVAVIILERRLTAYLVPTVSTAPVSQSTQYAIGPPLSLLPLVHRGLAITALAAPADPFAQADFGPDVRVIKYRGTFRASQAIEGADGNLYITYYWPPRGGIAYDPDRLGIVTGGAVRLVMAASFLDLVYLTGRAGGYPTFAVGTGSTPGYSELHGEWMLDAAGVHQVLATEPPYGGCGLCTGSSGQTTRPARCVMFAQGALCERQQRITYTRGGSILTTISGAHLIGGGPHRFLISADEDSTGVWDLEGFAP